MQSLIICVMWNRYIKESRKARCSALCPIIQVRVKRIKARMHRQLHSVVVCPVFILGVTLSKALSQYLLKNPSPILVSHRNRNHLSIQSFYQLSVDTSPQSTGQAAKTSGFVGFDIVLRNLRNALQVFLKWEGSPVSHCLLNRPRSGTKKQIRLCF